MDVMADLEQFYNESFKQDSSPAWEDVPLKKKEMLLNSYCFWIWRMSKECDRDSELSGFLFTFSVHWLLPVIAFSLILHLIFC